MAVLEEELGRSWQQRANSARVGGCETHQIRFPDSETTSSRKRQLKRHFGPSVEEQQQRRVHTFLESDVKTILQRPETTT